MNHYIASIFLILIFLSGHLFALSFPSSQAISTRPADQKLDLPAYVDNSEADSKPTSDKTDVQRDFSSIAGAKFTLKGLSFEGNQVFTNAQLNKVCQPFINQQVSLADLEELRFRLTNLYVQSGYENSGVLLPPQHINQGMVHFKIIEGQLVKINVTGNQRLNENYIRERLQLNNKNRSNNKKIFNSQQLQTSFRQLLSDPLIERLNGKIRPGNKLGEAILDIEVTRARAYDISFTADNHHPPSTGEYQGLLSTTLWNLSGLGDQLDLMVNATESNNNYYARYSVPISAKNTKVFISYANSQSAVIEESLKLADIESKYSTFNLGISHPYLRDLNRSLLFSLVFTHRDSQTFFLGEGVPFSEGVELDGRSSTSVIRFSQDFLLRGSTQALAARSTFNLGVSALNATINDKNMADSRFFSWLGQFQYIKRIAKFNSQIVTKANIQLANQRLLSLEQIAIGGPDSVRGYRTNQYIRDNGMDLSIEYRQPLWGNPLQQQQMNLQWAVFADVGSAWNKGQSYTTDILSSTGVGLLWQWKKASAELYWAYSFTEIVGQSKQYLQDKGISFRFNISY